MTSAHRVPRKSGAPLHQAPHAVRLAREATGLNQREMAAQLGISRQLMNDIENGHRSAQPAVLERIAAIASVDVDTLKASKAGPMCVVCAAVIAEVSA
ncbi:hypothetical protein B4N89_02520 [Embleya scabrispora]|uniref:HTH cro/C1-type domain-containing protein n=1 Tax=Embleya scabrispora TaxID=159449 RepID=A0A1T3NTL2_9ACTN|nr:helix-turn-helix transcriptional regulator [Embleya scabrispora]OPC79971.1 hypothetical protein B4N89_02520 [Embleya scabrispora]